MRIPFLKRRPPAPASDDALADFPPEPRVLGSADIRRRDLRAALQQAAQAAGAWPGDEAPKPVIAPPPLPRPAPPAPVLGRRTQIALALDTVVARRTDVLWYEGVAIVDRVCAELLGEDNTYRPAPAELSDILLQADGSLSVTPGTSRSGSANALARTLHEVVHAQTMPAALRLLVTKWIAAPDHHTVREFSADLAYFTRPDPATLIRAVYERALMMPAVPVRIPRPADEETRKPRSPRSQRPRPPAWAVASVAGVCASAAAAGVWWVQQPSAASGTQIHTTTASVNPSEAALTSPTVATDPAGSVYVSPDAPAPMLPARVGDIRLPASRRAARAESTTTRPDAPLSPRRPAAARAVVSSAPAASAVVFRVRDDDEIARVYSSADGDVDPPKMVYPQLPPPLFAGNAAVNTMEVTVSEDGAVERVRLVSSPQRMTDMMLLSGAKTWRFVPASREGQSVRYRMNVSWATTP